MNTENPPQPIKQESITPKQLYLTRRKFLESVGIFSAGAFLAACMGNPPSSPSTPIAPAGDMETRKDLALSYNNYYEFGTSKSSVAERAENFQMQPWQVEVGGLVKNPQIFNMEELLANFVQEERVYRMRCVEAWSMVLPWTGFPLAKLLEMAQPLPEAKFVAFQSVYRPEKMPGQVGLDFPWPYLEGLRLDEAQHPLTLLATGLYKEPLTPQNGGPIRLVVPWKYGFKSAKALVKITLQADQPVTFWNAIAPQEYGFYANVNPEVDHPRWSQATERRIGETGRRPTLMFNGYAEQVGDLYAGMDLRKNY